MDFLAKPVKDADLLRILFFIGNLEVAENLLRGIFPGVPVVATGLTEEEVPTGRFGNRVAGIAQHDAHA